MLTREDKLELLHKWVGAAPVWEDKEINALEDEAGEVMKQKARKDKEETDEKPQPQAC